MPKACFMLFGLLFVLVSPSAAQNADPGLLATHKDFLAAIKAANAEKITSFYADDAVIFGRNPSKGRAAILARYQRTAKEISSIVGSLQDARSSGDVGYTFEHFTDQGRAGRTGGVLMVWRRINNQWKIAYDSFYDDPQPAAK